MKKQPKFDVLLQSPRFTIYSLMVFTFEKFCRIIYRLMDLSTYHNIPKYNQNILSYWQSKSTLGFHATTAPGF